METKWVCYIHECPILGEPYFIPGREYAWVLDQSSMHCEFALGVPLRPARERDELMEECEWHELLLCEGGWLDITRAIQDRERARTKLRDVLAHMVEIGDIEEVIDTDGRQKPVLRLTAHGRAVADGSL